MLRMMMLRILKMGDDEDEEGDGEEGDGEE